MILKKMFYFLYPKHNFCLLISVKSILPVTDPDVVMFQLAYCVVQFLEKDSTLTEPVGSSTIWWSLSASCQLL